MHVALAGASGYIGRVFNDHIRRRGWRLSCVTRADLSGGTPEAITRALEAISPDFVINSAGYTGKPNVDACEVNQTACLYGNAVLPGLIAEACRSLGIHWGHVSSGCIFTGRRPDGNGFDEEDQPNFSFRQNNCSFYSGTKALGEELLADELDRGYIWRVRIPFSNVDAGRNYLSKLIRYDRILEAENSLSNLTEFVDAALDCFVNSIPFGIYHLTNPGSVKTSEVVELIRSSGVSQKSFKFFDSESDFMSRAARAPRSNCVLDSQKAIAVGLRLTPIRESLRVALENWIPERIHTTLSA